MSMILLFFSRHIWSMSKRLQKEPMTQSLTTALALASPAQATMLSHLNNCAACLTGPLQPLLNRVAKKVLFKELLFPVRAKVEVLIMSWPSALLFPL